MITSTIGPMARTFNKQIVMKNVLVIISFVFVLVLAGCEKSIENRAKKLVAEASKSLLYFPESYDQMAFECDSMFNRIITKDNVWKSAKILELMKEIERVQREIDFDRDRYESMSTYGIGMEYLAKCKRGEKKKKELLDKAAVLFNELVDEMHHEPEFHGFIAYDRFRAKNNSGNVLMGENVYILNKTCDQIVEVLDAQNEDVLQYMQMIALIQNNYSDDFSDEDIIELCKNIKSKHELIMQNL